VQFSSAPFFFLFFFLIFTIAISVVLLPVCVCVSVSVCDIIIITSSFWLPGLFNLFMRLPSPKRIPYPYQPYYPKPTEISQLLIGRVVNLRPLMRTHLNTIIIIIETIYKLKSHKSWHRKLDNTIRMRVSWRRKWPTEI